MDTMFNPLTGDTVEFGKAAPMAAVKGALKSTTGAMKEAHSAGVASRGVSSAAEAPKGFLNRASYFAGRKPVAASVAAGGAAGTAGYAVAKSNGALSTRYPDSLKGTPMIGKLRFVGSRVPAGKHVGHANDLKVVRRKARKNVGRYGETKLNVIHKADEPQASGGRKFWGSMAPGWHGAIAGKKGHKIGAGANEVGQGIAGALPGAAMQAVGAKKGNGKLLAAGTLANFAGGRAGSYHATVGNQRKGRYQAQVAKSDLASQPGMFNPGVSTASWSHGFTANPSFAQAAGRRGKRISAE